MKQKTISSELSWSGLGLHSGVNAKVTLKPRDPGYGIKISRTDLEKASVFPTDVKYVSSTLRGTNIKSGDTEIMTVEHLLSALAGAEVDNVLIEVDGPEVPILDGSAHNFYQDIMSNGFTEQEEDVDYLIIEKVIKYIDDDTGAELMVLPHDSFKADVYIDYDSDFIGQQFASYSEEEDYGKEIASSRTFVLAEDLKELQEQGLIKGGDIDNAIVLIGKEFPESEIREVLSKLGKNDVEQKIEKIKNGVALKFSNELARHKILDLIGDLRLVGAKIKGHIIAKKPGHGVNVAFAKLLREEYQRQRKLKGKPKYDVNAAPLYDAEKIKGLIPHRYPFLLVDKIIELSDNHVVGVKNVTINEQLFTGHFPDNPVFPGVLQMEALAQTGGILALNTVEVPDMWDTYFLKMDNVKFKRMVVPGDTMIMKMVLMSPIRRGIFHMQGTIYVGDNIVSEGELTAQIIKRKG